MNDALTTIGLVLLGMGLGLKMAEWWALQPPACSAPRVHAEPPPRLAQVECTCPRCQPPYWQESPVEVQ